MLPRVTEFTTYCIYNYIFVRVAHSVEVLKLIRRVHANKKSLFLTFTLRNITSTESLAQWTRMIRSL